MTPELLLVDDERSMRRVLTAALEKEGYKVHAAADGQEALSVLREVPVSVMISDIKMPRMDGMKLLEYTLEHYPDLPVILITAHGTVDTAVEALKMGAFDYITKPFDLDDIRQITQKALATCELNRNNFKPSLTERGRYDIIGRSEQMEKLYGVISRVADTPSTVLITGESGTGKELIARALHDNSARRDMPFVAINCAAIPQNLMESELFGYDKGAFTGAQSSKPGRFELADGGTLFLDEIAEIPVEMQVKLLRVLQQGEFERVGGIHSKSVDVRLVAATNQDLQLKIRDGSFRDDLYYRLNVVPVHLPPLRERRADIPLLVEHFLEKYNKRLNRSIEALSDKAIEALQEYRWPGNIRELENVIERSLLFADASVVDVDELPPEITNAAFALHTEVVVDDAVTVNLEEVESISLPQMWRQQKERFEHKMLSRALESTQWNVTRAAEKLGISRKSMQKKMKELGLRET